MDCDRCHERPARYHVTRVVNGQTVEDANLCERCAAERGEVPAPHEAPATIHDLLAGLLAAVEAEPVAPGTPAPPARCPRCGTAYAEFARTGLLGCAACYEAFAVPLEAVVRRIHGKTRHEGKVPRRAWAETRRQRELADLRRALEQAVAEEQFERAAVLRDRIRALGGEGR